MTAVLLLPIAALPVRGFCRARLLPTAPVHHPRPPLLLKARQADHQRSRGTTRDFSRPPPSPELKAKQNKVASIVGVAYFSQFGVILAAALARLGLLKPPPFNSLTNIANAEMERAVAAGDVPPLMATVYAQQFWIGLVRRDSTDAGEISARPRAPDCFCRWRTTLLVGRTTRFFHSGARTTSPSAPPPG